MTVCRAVTEIETVTGAETVTEAVTVTVTVTESGAEAVTVTETVIVTGAETATVTERMIVTGAATGAETVTETVILTATGAETELVHAEIVTAAEVTETGIETELVHAEIVTATEAVGGTGHVTEAVTVTVPNAETQDSSIWIPCLVRIHSACCKPSVCSPFQDDSKLCQCALDSMHICGEQYLDWSHVQLPFHSKLLSGTLGKREQLVSGPAAVLLLGKPLVDTRH